MSKRLTSTTGIETDLWLSSFVGLSGFLDIRNFTLADLVPCMTDFVTESLTDLDVVRVLSRVSLANLEPSDSDFSILSFADFAELLTLSATSSVICFETVPMERKTSEAEILSLFADALLRGRGTGRFRTSFWGKKVLRGFGTGGVSMRNWLPRYKEYDVAIKTPTHNKNEQ